MTCFLKRGLPFALTLVIGLVLGSLLGKARQPTDLVWGTHVGIGEFKLSSQCAGRELIYSPGSVDQKAVVRTRPQPTYTEEARHEMLEGTVVLRAVFSADGSVRKIYAVSGLPYGLTDKAIEAAKGIEFSPALKDGQPVSQYIQIEYNFSLY